MDKRVRADFGSCGFSKRASPAPTTVHYRDRQVVYAQGDAADAMFCIRWGHVKLTIAGNGKGRAVTAILGAGDCFGEDCLIKDSSRRSTAVSIHRSTIDRVSRNVMVRRLRREPALARLFMSHLLHRIGRVEDDLVGQLMNSSERRLAQLLLKLSDYGNRSGRAPVEIEVDQATLAQAVGTTRSRVSHFMNQFRKRGFIGYKGSVHVHQALLTFLLREPPPN